MEKNATFVEASDDLDDQLDAAYRDKYHRYGAQYVDPIVSAEARAVAVERHASDDVGKRSAEENREQRAADAKQGVP